MNMPKNNLLKLRINKKICEIYAHENLDNFKDIIACTMYNIVSRDITPSKAIVAYDINTNFNLFGQIDPIIQYQILSGSRDALSIPCHKYGVLSMSLFGIILFPLRTASYLIHMEYAGYKSNSVPFQIIYRPYPRDVYAGS